MRSGEPRFAPLAFDVVILGEARTRRYVCKQASAASQAASVASIFAILASAPQGLPASNSAAASRTIRSAASHSA